MIQNGAVGHVLTGLFSPSGDGLSMPKVALVSAILLAASMAGCVNDGKARPQSTNGSNGTDSTSAAEAPNPVGEGAIQNAVTGLVVDEEFRPIAEAEVRIIGSNLFDRTGDDGFYKIESIPIGDYQLRATRAGFANLTLKVRAPEEGVTWANFTMRLQVDSKYVQVYSRTVYIDFAESESHYGVFSKFNQTCKDCKVPIRMFEDPRHMMVEFLFKPSYDYPNHDERVSFSAYWNTTIDGPYAQSGVHPEKYIKRGSARDRGNVSFVAPTEIRAATGVLTLYIDGGVRFPMIDQRVTLWISIAHRGDLPPGWTAAPPAEG